VSVDSAALEGNNGSFFVPSPPTALRGLLQRREQPRDADTNVSLDVFVRDRQAGTTERVSVDSAGAQVTGFSTYSSISADGRYIAFQSYASGLVAGDTNNVPDVFLRDRLLGSTVRLSVDSGGAGERRQRRLRTLDLGDGRHIAFQSYARTSCPRTRTRSWTSSCASTCRPSRPSASATASTRRTPRLPVRQHRRAGERLRAQLRPERRELDRQRHDDRRRPRAGLLFHARELVHALLQHDAAGDFIFHDGVLCAGGTLIRLRGRNAVLGAASFPNPLFDSTITLSQRGGVFPGQGVRRYYSAWYRNASPTFCPPATANVTNGLFVDW
jgi:hypothetical protein